MDLTITPLAQILSVTALILGFVLGWSARSGLRRKLAVQQERADALTRERDGLNAEKQRLLGEVKAKEQQIRPLAEELDKLRRDFARARGQDHATPAETRAIDPNDLSQLKGVGAKFAARLDGAGITRIDQIAGWTSADIDVIDSQMGDFRGRIASDRLVEQAKLLSEGRYTEYEAMFGALGPR